MIDNKKHDALLNTYVGTVFTVVHCKGAKESFDEAVNSLKKGKRKSFKMGMITQIERLSKGERMSKERFPQEGDLPKRKGQQKAKQFYALKRIPVRGYCWLSTKHKNTYFISHYIYKNFDDLSEKDINKVGNNWRRIEENGDEC